MSLSKNNGSIRLGQIFHLSPIKRNLKYLQGNMKGPIKNIYLESTFQQALKWCIEHCFSLSSDQILKLILG